MARGLVAHRGRDVVAKERERPLCHERLEFQVALDPRPIEREPERERSLVVHAHSHRPRQAREPRAQPLRRQRLERRQRLAPVRGVSVLPLVQFGRELEEPGESVRALEPFAAFGAEVGGLGRQPVAAGWRRASRATHQWPCTAECQSKLPKNAGVSSRGGRASASLRIR